MNRAYQALVAALTLLMVVGLVRAEGQVTLVGGGSPWGPGVFRDNVWGTVSAIVRNTADVPIEVLIVTQFGQTKQFQFATRVTLPAQSLYRLLQPVRMFQAPVDPEVDFVQETVTTRLIDPATEPERQLADYDGLLTIDQRFPIVAFIGDGISDDTAEIMTSFGEGLGWSNTRPDSSGRVHVLRQKTMLASQAPRFAAGWDAVDSLVIALERSDLDLAQTEAIRQWLVGGGRLWLLMDQVPAELGTRLLGEDFTCRVVQRTSMTRVNVNGIGQYNSHMPKVDADRPIDMVRVVAPGFEVLHEVDGWPVSLRRRVGQGEVLLTTVGPRAWLDARKRPLPILSDLKSLFLATDAQPRQADEAILNLITSQVGYKVVGRGPVITVFILLVGSLLGAGLWLRKRGRRPGRESGGGLELIGIVGIGLSLLATAALAGLDFVTRGDMKTTVATVQLVTVTPSQGLADVEAILGYYTPPPRSHPTVIESNAGGWIVSDPSVFQGDEPRMVWTDYNQWSWNQPALKPGALRTAKLKTAITWEHPPTVRMNFENRKLLGVIDPGPLTGLSDPVLVLTNGHMVPSMDGQTRFSVSANQTPASDEFSSGVTLSDVQAGRQKLLRTFSTNKHAPMPVSHSAQPLLLVWADAIELGMNYASQAERNESALVRIPIEFVRPEPGTEVHIPTALIPFFPDDPMGLLKGGPYRVSTREWVDEKSTSAQFVLRFQLPAQVLPLDLSKAELKVQVRAKDWKMALCNPFVSGFEYLDGSQVESPMGTKTFNLAKWPVLFERLDAGAIYVKFRVWGGQGQAWRIEGMSLQVSGVTLKPQPDGRTR